MTIQISEEFSEEHFNEKDLQNISEERQIEIASRESLRSLKK